MLMRVYLPPSTLEHLPDLEEALDRFLGKDPIVIIDLHEDIRRLQNPQIQQVANFLTSFGMFDLLSNIRHWIRFQHMKTWWKVIQGILFRSRCNYVLL